MTPERGKEARFGSLSTEDVSEGGREIDLATTAELVRAMNEEDRTVPDAVAAAAGSIAEAVDAVAARLDAGGRLLYFGAGTSGRMGMLDSVECRPTFDTEPGRIVAVLAGGDDALADADEGAEDDASAGRRAIAERRVEAADAVVGVTASGRTPFVLAAVVAARERGAATVGLSCNAGAELSALVEHPIEVVTGPEFLAGSTRLKAGTAQKQVLNMISTIAMIRLGKTFGNLMVDLRAGNEKLRERAVRIVELAAETDPDTARRALAASGGETKAAILALRAGIDPAEAARRLAASGGRLRKALAPEEER